MTDREKIAQIIAEHLCPQGKAHKTLYGAGRRCYSRDNFAECEKVSKCVDALIKAGIGDCAALMEKWRAVLETQCTKTEEAERRARVEADVPEKKVFDDGYGVPVSFVIELVEIAFRELIDDDQQKQNKAYPLAGTAQIPKGTETVRGRGT